MIDDFLVNMATGLAQSLLEAGVRRLKGAVLGSDAEKALTAALSQGFVALLEEVKSTLPDDDLHIEHLDLVHTIFVDFFRQPHVAEHLLSLALAGDAPDLDLLAQHFEQLEFDRATLTVDFERCLLVYHQGVTKALVAKASQTHSDLFNQVSLGRLLTIQALLQDQAHSLAQIGQTIARIEQVAPQTIYNVVVENATGLAIGDHARVEQTSLSVEVQGLLAEILAIVRAMQQKQNGASQAHLSATTLGTEQIAQFEAIFVRLLQSAPGTWKIAIGAKTSLAHARNQIQQVAEYKETHDLLQQVDQSSMLARDLIYEDEILLTEKRLRWHNIRRCCLMVQSDREKLCRYGQDASFRDDARDWIEEFTWAGEKLQQALAVQDADLLNQAIEDIRNVINQQTSRFNDRLMGAIGALELAKLVRMLRDLYHNLKAHLEETVQNAPDNVDQLDEILTSFAALAERLEILRREHDRWQQIDNKLRPELTLVFTNLPRFKRQWSPILRTRILEQCAGIEANWVRELKLSITDVDTALEQDAPRAVSVAVYACHGAVNRRFIQVDVDLKRLCGVLATVGNSLDTILDTMG
jgi:hypothetical protein